MPQPSAASPVKRRLVDWIRDAEQEQPAKKETAVAYADDEVRDLLALKSTTPSESVGLPLISDRIFTELEMLWADINFWKTVSSTPDDCGYQLRWYISSKHKLYLPEFPPHVWKSLATATEERTMFFKIICQQDWRWQTDTSTLSSDRVKIELEHKGFKSLVDDYFHISRIDSRLEMTRSLASRGFSRDALKKIKSLAVRLAKDAEWCIDHKGKIPADKVRQNRGQPTKIKRVHLIESLADLVKKTPSETDDRIAQFYLNSGSTSEGEKKNKRETLRKLVAEAKRLVAVREEVKVIHHVDQNLNCGRRPSRKVGVLAN